MNPETRSEHRPIAGRSPAERDRPAVATPGALRMETEPRPHPNLLVYFAVASLVLGPFFPVLLIPHYFRYRTLRYRFDDEGVTMSWGLLFRREISLTYARIQDIHLTSNLLERWLSLGRIQIQTASGSAGAEMTIEGLQEFELIRDFLYSRMRGARKTDRGGRARVVPAGEGKAAAVAPASELLDELNRTLRAATAELRALRLEVEAGRVGRPEGDRDGR